MSDSSATFSGLLGPLYGMLQHLKVHRVQHGILWPGDSIVCTPHIVKSEIYVRVPQLNEQGLIGFKPALWEQLPHVVFHKPLFILFNTM